jgi:hypothetical protein
VFEREKDVAVSDATMVLKGDLRKSNRGVECLKKTQGKSEVKIIFHYIWSAKPSPPLK